MHFKQMFVTAVCVLFLLELKWPKSKNFYEGGGGGGGVGEKCWASQIFCAASPLGYANSK